MAIDFKKLREDYINSLEPEERERRILTSKLIKENTFYETIGKVSYIKDGKVLRTFDREFSLFRRVTSDAEVDNVVILSFGGYSEYRFDMNFYARRLQLEKDKNMSFCIDMGNRLYIENIEMIRVLDDCLHALSDKGIQIEEDYSAEFRKTEMGKMVQGLGLL